MHQRHLEQNRSADICCAVQPDFTRGLTLHRSPDGSRHVQLWTHVTITASGQHSAARGRSMQLPGQRPFWFPPTSASSPCGEVCLLLSKGPNWHVWAAHSAAVTPLYQCRAGVKTSIDWLPGTGSARLVCMHQHCLPPSSTASSDDEADHVTRCTQVQVLASDGSLLAESAELRERRDPESRTKSAVSPDGALIAVSLETELVVLTLADCSVLLRLPAGEPLMAPLSYDYPLEYSLWWSPASSHVYLGCTEVADHAVCCLQSCSWLGLSWRLADLRLYEYVIGWSTPGLLDQGMGTAQRLLVHHAAF